MSPDHVTRHAAVEELRLIITGAVNREASQLGRTSGQAEAAMVDRAPRCTRVGRSRRLIMLEVAVRSAIEEVQLRVRAGENPLDAAWREALIEELVAEHEFAWVVTHMRGD